MCNGPGGKREFHLNKIHCGVQYTWSLGECELMPAGGETSRLQMFERTSEWGRLQGLGICLEEDSSMVRMIIIGPFFFFL